MKRGKTGMGEEEEEERGGKRKAADGPWFTLLGQGHGLALIPAVRVQPTEFCCPRSHAVPTVFQARSTCVRYIR